MDDNLKILWISSEEYFSRLDFFYDNNYEVDVCKDSIFSLDSRISSNISNLKYDLIMFYNKSKYRFNDCVEMMVIASNISLYQGKKVSVGYSYVSPIDNNCVESYENIEIITYLNGDKKNMEKLEFKNLSINDLINSTLCSYNKVNNKKLARRNK